MRLTAIAAMLCALLAGCLDAAPRRHLEVVRSPSHQLVVTAVLPDGRSGDAACPLALDTPLYLQSPGSVFRKIRATIRAPNGTELSAAITLELAYSGKPNYDARTITLSSDAPQTYSIGGAEITVFISPLPPPGVRPLGA